MKNSKNASPSSVGTTNGYAEIEEEGTDLKTLQDWFEKIRKLDFYGATLAEEAADRPRS